jgi:hypothetical protein
MVDIVNAIELIIPKMRLQMLQKKIYSLDVLYQALAEQGPFVNIKELDIFLGKFGIFLKSQEVTELLNYTRHSETQMNFERMLALFKSPLPEDIDQALDSIFYKLSDKQENMVVGELLKHLNEKEFPQCELLGKNLQKIKDVVYQGMFHIIGDKKLISREEFKQFHNYIYWILPDFCISNYKLRLPLMWGLRSI